jgi:DNA (cytosine-5)-methyltransferase 1
MVQPVAIIIENVPDILNFGGHNVPEEICNTLEELGYTGAYTLLNAAFYGVPQMRERLFLVAIDKSLGVVPSFPAPTRHFQLPSGYASARSVALKHIPADGGRFAPSPLSADTLPGPVSVREALNDLPRITEHFKSPKDMRRRSVSTALPYHDYVGLTDYAKLMRSWPGHGGVVEANGHVVRLTPRDFPIFSRMERGGDYPHAHEVAHRLFQEALAQDASVPSEGSPRWKELHEASIPPYDPSKFPNKWWKLDPDKPSRTLTAHMGKDTYSHIHWDSRQKRTVSVREAARLQSFPDSFQFAGAMNAAFRQIGNAVPPLLAKAVAETLLVDLRREPVPAAETVDQVMDAA